VFAVDLRLETVAVLTRRVEVAHAAVGVIEITLICDGLEIHFHQYVRRNHLGKTKLVILTVHIFRERGIGIVLDRIPTSFRLQK
jgi:hypothetical protein